MVEKINVQLFSALKWDLMWKNVTSWAGPLIFWYYLYLSHPIGIRLEKYPDKDATGKASLGKQSCMIICEIYIEGSKRENSLWISSTQDYFITKTTGFGLCRPDRCFNRSIL